MAGAVDNAILAEGRIPRRGDGGRRIGGRIGEKRRDVDDGNCGFSHLFGDRLEVREIP